MATEKQCNKCKQVRPVSEFGRDKSKPDGLRRECKACYREYYMTHQEQRKEYNAEYYATHHKEVSERCAKRHVAHREQDNERSAKYYVTHREEVRKYYIEYRATHKEQIAKRDAEYQATHPEVMAANNERRRAWKAKALGNGIIAGQWNFLKEEYSYLCAYCNQKKPLAMDHVIPLSKDGRHDIDNIVPACRSCNASKNNSSLLMFLYHQV